MPRNQRDDEDEDENEDEQKKRRGNRRDDENENEDTEDEDEDEDDEHEDEDEDASDSDKPEQKKSSLPVWVLLLIAVIGTMLVSGCVSGGAVYVWMSAAMKQTGVTDPNGNPSQGAPSSGKPEDVLPQTLNYTYKGGNAEFWGKMLYEQDVWQFNEIEIAMFNMKEEGLRFVYSALSSKNEEARTRAANSFAPEGKDYPNLFIPKLRQMLTSGSEQEKVAAGMAASRGHFRELIPDLRTAMKGLHPDSVKTLNAYINDLSR